MKAVILDMYRVIVKQTGDDFAPYVQQTFPNLETQEILNTWFKADIGKITSLEVWKRLGFKGNLKKIEKEYLDTIELNDNFIRFISCAKKKFKTAIISNDSSNRNRYLRQKFDLDKYFDVISVSGDLKMQKPDKGIFEYTLRNLDCASSDCLYVDDRENNLTAAQEIGMNAVMFGNGSSFTGNSVTDFTELGDMLKL